MKNSLPGIPELEINNLFCIGRNYALHAKELNNPVPDEPLVFLKPNSAILMNGGKVTLPDQSNDVHHEVELVIAIGKKGKNIPEEDAHLYIAGYGIGIDLTARDLQRKAKESGKPWTTAKGFDTFAPISSFNKFNTLSELQGLELELRVNGETRQKGNTKEMLFPLPALVSYLSGIFTLQAGDLIFTGTPAGVGPVQKGDQLEATLGNDLLTLKVYVE